MLKISIIVPHYREPEDILFFGLSMLNNQRCVNFNSFEVIIVNDGPDSIPISNEFLAKFSNLHTLQFTTPKNGGPGYARQYGIDNSSAEFVYFMDCDDGPSDCLTLRYYFETLEAHPEADMLQGYEMFEIDDRKPLKSYRLNKASYNTWVHGYCIRREKLNELGIRFFDNLRFNEDGAYSIILQTPKLNRLFIDYVVYYRTCNKKSLTHTTDSDFDKITFIDGVDTAITFMKEHGENYNDADVVYNFYGTLIHAFLSMFGLWTNQDAYEKYGTRLFEYFKHHFDIFATLSKEYKNEIFAKILSHYVEMQKEGSISADELNVLTNEDLENFLHMKDLEEADEAHD